MNTPLDAAAPTTAVIGPGAIGTTIAATLHEVGRRPVSLPGAVHREQRRFEARADPVSAHRTRAAHAAGEVEAGALGSRHCRCPDQRATGRSGRPCDPWSLRGRPHHWDQQVGTVVERTTGFTTLVHLPREHGWREQPIVKNGPALSGYGAVSMNGRWRQR